MSFYLLINILIIIFPLIFSFQKRFPFYKKWPQVAVSMLLVSTVYILWDVYVTERGDWSFNPEYVGELKIFGLPLEEILFFITVPYSMIFIYESFRFYLHEKIKAVPFMKNISFIMFPLFAAAAFINYEQSYTFLALTSCAVFFAVSWFFYEVTTGDTLYWIFILFSYIPFIAVNYFLTSIPVVLYNPEEIWGIRFLTIPFEDFFYSFSMLSLYILVYSAASKKLKVVWDDKTPK